MTEHREYEELAAGEWGRIVGIRTLSGDCPAYEWLASLDARGQAGMRARLEQLAARGTLKTPENFRQLTDEGDPVVLEVKHVALSLRLYVIKGRHVYYATHGGSKPKKSRVAAAIQRARRIYAERRGQ